jgi:hypothetical protein
MLPILLDLSLRGDTIAKTEETALPRREQSANNPVNMENTANATAIKKKANINREV